MDNICVTAKATYFENDKNGTITLKVVCPFCNKTHTHGGGIDPNNIIIGHRRASCFKGGYDIVKTNKPRMIHK